MTDAELDQVEVALGRRVPDSFRQFVRECPPREFRRHFPYFYARPRDMIRYNQSKAAWPDDHSVREPDGAGGFLPERPWPDDWLAVGDADSEWCYIVRPDDAGLWEWHHDHRKVTRIADSLEAALVESQREKGNAPALEVFTHPTLGELSWNPESRLWTLQRTGRAGESILAVIEPGDADLEAFLSIAADLLSRAVASEPEVFAAAMTAAGWIDFLEYMANDPDLPAGLTAETIRDHLRWEGLRIEHDSNGPSVQYRYEADDAIGMEYLFITTDTDLRFREHRWLL